MTAEEKLTLLLEFVEHVRRTGDTRLASMAIATLNKVRVSPSTQKPHKP